MTDQLLRVVRWLVAALRVISASLLIASVALNCANVIGRYFFNTSIFWAEEIMLYLMVACVFLGNGVVAWSGRQLRMDVIVAMMPAQLQRVLALVAELTFVVVAVAIVVFAWPVIRDLWLFDQRSQSAELPMVIPQIMIPIGPDAKLSAFLKRNLPDRWMNAIIFLMFGLRGG